MKIPTFDYDKHTIPVIHTTPIEFTWEEHAIILKRKYYYSDGTMVCWIDILVDGVEVDSDLSWGNEDLPYDYNEFDMGEFDFGDFVYYFQQQPSEEFCKTLEFIVKAHLESLKENV